MLRDGATLIVDPEHAVEVVTGLLADQGYAFGKPVSPRERAVDLAGDLRRIYDAVTESARSMTSRATLVCRRTASRPAWPNWNWRALSSARRAGGDERDQAAV